LAASGYTGEGFLGQGAQLGGDYVPADEVRRRARASAADRERDRIKRGRKLGNTGANEPSGRSGSLGIRDAVAIAAIQRESIIDQDNSKGKGKRRGQPIEIKISDTEEILAGCGQGNKRAEREAQDALRNGFSTKEDMDEANWMAIQEAQFELEEKQEQKRLAMGLPPTDQQAGQRPGTAEDGGYTWDSEYGLRHTDGWKKPAASQPVRNDASASASRPSRSVPPKENRQSAPPLRSAEVKPGKPVSRLVREAEEKKKSKKSSSSSSSSSSNWACSACTFVNKNNKTKCEVCESDRPAPKPRATITKPAPSEFTQSFGWSCPRCTTFMGHEWWTCSSCGAMKLNS
jgi:hypothetical protein